MIAWLDRADTEAARRNEIVHTIWLRVDKPEPGAVAYAHFGPKAARQGCATVEQVQLSALDRGWAWGWRASRASATIATYWSLLDRWTTL